MTLTSSAFADGSPIPRRFTCDGANVSPPLAWTGTPSGTASLALIVHDPDAPSDFVHWVVYDINPATFDGLPEGWSGTSDAAPQGDNDRGDPAWTGPCPPSGTHHYVFRLLALDMTLQLRAGASADDVLGAAEGHILGEATLTGTYRRA
jgi:Raf kinase inhibitor-like YbhB/YbcL family protein